MKPFLVAAVIKPVENNGRYEVCQQPKLVMATDEVTASAMVSRDFAVVRTEDEMGRLEVFVRPF